MEKKLHFIVGASGSGKSEHLFTKLIQKSLEHPEKNYILVVPEQFTMETQKKVVLMHPSGAVANIDIVSFNRLAFRVFSELGILQAEMLDDTGKSLILRKVIANEREQLNIYREKVHMHGFVEEMKSVISELYMYGIGMEKYKEIREQVKGNALISEKLKDIEVVFEGFRSYIEDKYITKEELLDRLCDAIPKSGVIRESELYFDGFTGFTPVQNKAMKLLLEYSVGITITVTAGREEYAAIQKGIACGMIPVMEQELFKMSKETINTLLKMYDELFGKTGLERIAGESIFLDGRNGRFRNNPVLAHLEEQMFRPGGKRVKNDGSVMLLRFDGPRSEVEYITDYIAWQVKKGMRYRDFAIICGDMDSYGRILADNLNTRNIPYFMDNKRSLILNPAVTFIRAVLEVIDTDFSYESVFRFLKSGIEVLDMDDVDILENYVLAGGIRGAGKYFKEFTLGRRRMAEQDLERVNRIREEFVDAIREIYDDFKGKTGGLSVHEMTESLYRFLVKFRLSQRLSEMEQEFLERGELSFGREYGQTYKYIIDLFDKIVSLLGGEVMPLKEYRQILDAGFEEIKVGVIPLSMDQVLVGDIERTRLSSIKILLVLGVNDGIIPKHGKKSSLLSQSDRNYLKKMEIDLSPTIRESIFIQKFYLYLNLTKPQKGLVLSYSDSSMDGSALRPSYLTGEIARLYDSVENVLPVREEYLNLSSDAASLKYLSEHLNRNEIRDMDGFLKELYSYFQKHGEYGDIISDIRQGLFFDNNPTKLSSYTSAQLAGQGMIKSVSRLEKYAACAYAHFLTYGLKLAKREKYEINMADMGTIYHKCLELFSAEMLRQNYDYRTITDVERNSLVDKCVTEITENYENMILKSSKRNEYLIRKIKSVCRKTVWAMCEHVKRGDFTPQEFEFAFKEGRIDRVDTYEKDGKLYLKIIDYKSGSKKFDLSDVFNGLQLQLIYYMGETLKIKEVLEQGKEVLPAGTFYFNIKSPYIECSEEIQDEKLQELLLKEYKMTGLVNDMIEPAVAMDHILEEEKAESVIVPLKTKDLGSAVSSSGMNSTNFRRMIDRVERMMDEFTEEILEGRIEKNPYRKGMNTPCEYCSYRSVCNFDEREFGNQYKKTVKISKPEDVLKELEQEGKHELD